MGPAVTRKQVLPFGDLTWQDFERLCLRLARRDDAMADWRLYGEAGEEQGGIDILAREPRSGRHAVWQVKRHRRFSEAKLDAAVEAFRVGEWAGRTQRFVLATAASLRSTTMVKALGRVARDLAAEGVDFEALDAERLSERLKASPEIVDDFFDRAWVEAFCGRRAADGLGDRLDRSALASLRSQLSDVYRAHFSSVDPGVTRALAPMASPPTPLPLGSRFVPLDLLADAETQAGRERDGGVERRPADAGGRAAGGGDAMGSSGTPRTPERSFRRRQPFGEWWRELERAIVIGTPGAGKSTLLRMLALDMLEAAPRFTGAGERRRGYLPIWISFPFWTGLITANGAAGGVSVADAVARWLEVQGEAQLVPLARRALVDGRVVLLVDGVDEWSDEDAAGTALTLLNGLVERRGCPAVVTSRLYGERSFRALDAAWVRRELAPMTERQQVAFAAVWFQAAGGGDPVRSAGRAEAFIGEVARSSRLAGLAGTPLLLGGLIGLRLAGAALPRGRSQAYAELTARLLDGQPAARDRAALRTVRDDGLDRDTRDRLLAALAFHVQSETAPAQGFDAVPRTAATAFCKAHLQEALDLPPHEALRRAEQSIAHAERSLGILVGKSRRDLGFMHRVFQEFLAARHVSTLDLDDQLSIVRRHGADPAWRDVLLSALHLLTRTSEVDAAVAVLEGRRMGDPSQDGPLEVLLADVVFGGVALRPETARRLAVSAFGEVETGSESIVRQEILQRVVAGSGTPAISALVSAKLRHWFPSWHDPVLAETLRLMVGWPEAAVDDVLWRNLHHARPDVRTQAARGLAERRGGDPAWRDRLAAAAREPQGFGSCAAALEALAAGWPDEATAATDLARLSEEPTILIGGVVAAIRLGRHAAGDRERLCVLIGDGWNVPEGVGAALVAGWPGDPTLKAFLLSDRERLRGAAHGPARILVKAFPGTTTSPARWSNSAPSWTGASCSGTHRKPWSGGSGATHSSSRRSRRPWTGTRRTRTPSRGPRGSRRPQP